MDGVCDGTRWRAAGTVIVDDGTRLRVADGAIDGRGYLRLQPERAVSGEMPAGADLLVPVDRIDDLLRLLCGAAHRAALALSHGGEEQGG